MTSCYVGLRHRKLAYKPENISHRRFRATTLDVILLPSVADLSACSGELPFTNHVFSIYLKKTVSWFTTVEHRLHIKLRQPHYSSTHQCTTGKDFPSGPPTDFRLPCACRCSSRMTTDMLAHKYCTYTF